MSKVSNSNTNAFNIETFPLFGTRLIEASAGTGKTFAITNLYLRLLLGHGGPYAFPKGPLRVEKILVVTFTESATTELRGRIRERIHRARVAFTRGRSHDPVIASLLRSLKDHIQAEKLLYTAEREIDSASIYTIHGFCHRVLLWNAFELGSGFVSEFVNNESALKKAVVEDYWRKQLYAIDLELAAEIRRFWSSPHHLFSQISRYLSGREPQFSIDISEASLGEIYRKHISSITEIKQAWVDISEDVEQIVEKSGANRRVYSKRFLPVWITSITRWATSPTTSCFVPEVLQKFAQNVLNEQTKNEGIAPTHDVFMRIEIFFSRQASLKASLLGHAIRSCRLHLQRTKQEKLLLSFDDLLLRLSSALDYDSDNSLKNRIRSLYPVVMIDEFQDTDPLQYSIFSQIYLKMLGTGLFMIGDPKQAIYAFRGADIFTYTKARKQVPSRFTLRTNWRSTASMVNATNKIFGRCSSPFISDDIPFSPVSTNPKAQDSCWIMHGEKQPAVTLWWQEEGKVWSKNEYCQRMAHSTANHIQTVLECSQRGEAHFLSENRRRKILPIDIAVLVRTGVEARLIRNALGNQGIASAYISSKESIFSTPLAKDIIVLLEALVNVDNKRKLKACLASSLFGIEMKLLGRLNEDHCLWASTVAEFRDYAKVWVTKGVLPMLRSVLFKRQIPQRWLNNVNGERALTDFLHIGEQLQQASFEVNGQSGLLRWLKQGVLDAEKDTLGSEDNIDNIQRLDSDREVIRIFTIHKSKGLEYGLVYLPFIMNFRGAQEASYYDALSEQTTLDLLGNRSSLARADKERLAEDIRLFYVAITRAIFGCFMGVVPLKSGVPKSLKSTSAVPTSAQWCALGSLLLDGKGGSINNLRSALLNLSDSSHPRGSVVVSPPVGGINHLFCRDVGVKKHLYPRLMSKGVDRSWCITSYSDLVKPMGDNIPSCAVPGGNPCYLDHYHRGVFKLSTAEKKFRDFPRGVRGGKILHTIFEKVDISQRVDNPTAVKQLTELLEAECLELDWIPAVQALIHRVANTPLDGNSLFLKDVHRQKCVCEMEFFLPLKLLHSRVLNQVRGSAPLSEGALDLDFSSVRGMMKGFIDLIFEKEGLYYVLDWKSNYLGDSPEDYSPNKLGQVMVDKRYDFQCQLYTLAVHRFLTSRIPDYSYGRHFGGFYCLFLRGIDGLSTNGVFHIKLDFSFVEKLERILCDDPINIPLGSPC